MNIIICYESPSVRLAFFTKHSFLTFKKHLSTEAVFRFCLSVAIVIQAISSKSQSTMQLVDLIKLANIANRGNKDA